MLTGLLVAAAASTCAWPDPGHDPFMGDVVAAVDRYTDIPPGVRAELQRRMELRQYDELVPITRDGVPGYAGLRDMHFGAGRICRGAVDHSMWPSGRVERGLIYCVDEHCVIVPTVCRNVSRITRLPPSRALLDIPGGWADSAQQLEVGPPALLDVPQIVVSPPAELAFEAPAAGQRMRSLDAPGVMITTLVTIGGGLPSIGAGLPPIGGGLPSSPGVADEPVAAIPEPGTLALLALGLTLVGLAVWIGRRKP